MQRDFGREHLTAFAKKAKISPGTASRIKEQSTSVGLDVLDQIAHAFNVQPWHLLSPGLGQSGLASSHPVSIRWPFEHVSQADYESLPPEERLFIQGFLAGVIAEKNRARERMRKVA